MLARLIALAGSASIAAAGRAGLVDHDFAQQGQRRPEVLPDPDGQAFAGRIVQTSNVIEVVVVEPVVQGLERRLDLGEIHDPSGVRVDFTTDMEFHPE